MRRWAGGPGYVVGLGWVGQVDLVTSLGWVGLGWAGGPGYVVGQVDLVKSMQVTVRFTQGFSLKSIKRMLSRIVTDGARGRAHDPSPRPGGRAQQEPFARRTREKPPNQSTARPLAPQTPKAKGRAYMRVQHPAYMGMK